MLHMLSGSKEVYIFSSVSGGWEAHQQQFPILFLEGFYFFFQGFRNGWVGWWKRRTVLGVELVATMLDNVPGNVGPHVWGFATKKMVLFTANRSNHNWRRVRWNTSQEIESIDCTFCSMLHTLLQECWRGMPPWFCPWSNIDRDFCLYKCESKMLESNHRYYRLFFRKVYMLEANQRYTWRPLDLGELSYRFVHCTQIQTTICWR